MAFDLSERIKQVRVMEDSSRRNRRHWTQSLSSTTSSWRLGGLKF